MSKYIQQKKELVSKLSSEFLSNQSFLVFEFTKLNSENVNDLRKNLRSLDSKLVIRKNNIIERGLEDAKLVSNFKLSGQNAVLLSNNIAFLPLKNIVDMSKKLDHIKLKLAYFDKILFEKDNLDILANLKSKTEAVTSIAQLMLCPIYKLLFVLKNLKHE